MTFAIMLASGISQGIQPIVGNNYGAESYKRVMETLYKSSVFSVGVTCIIWLIVMFFPKAILLSFCATDEMFALGIVGLRTNFCITPILGFVMLATTFFQSIAKPIPSIVITFLRQILFLIHFIYILPIVLGINGIFMVQPISDVLALIISIVLIIREKRVLYRINEIRRRNQDILCNR